MGWLFAAYAVVWIVLFLYVFNLDRKQKQISDEIAALKNKLTS